jgi:hypothetical protein
MAYIRTPVPLQVRGKTVRPPQQGGMPMPIARPRGFAEEVQRNTVKVYATSEKFAKAMNYLFGRTGQRVLFAADGSAEWPRDTFTQRRLKAGDISLTPPKKEPEAPSAASASEQRQPRRVTSHRPNNVEGVTGPVGSH